MNARSVSELGECVLRAMKGRQTPHGIAMAVEAEVVEPLRARVAELEAAAGLIAEYRVPTAEKWLSVRREPNGVRWAITQTFGHSPMRVWTGERWTSVGLAADGELWRYDTAEAALADARRLAGAGESR